MVGVPGRSKACNTCRQRKVACSLEKPDCRTCIKASRICSGYQRERVFILGPGTTYHGPKDSKLKSGVGGCKEISIRQQKNRPSQPKTEGGIAESNSSSVHVAKINSISSNAAYRQQILSEFLACSMPSNGGSSLREISNGNWLASIASLPDITTALEAAILAVSTAKLGRIGDNQVLVHESLKFYVQGLWELQKALWNPKLMYKDETLAACMSMIFYEVTECPDKKLDGWTNHMQGCARMFELRGPDTYGSDFGHQLFLSFRIIEIQQAFAERRHTFLANPEWTDLPFRGRPKSMFQRLLDLVALVPNIIADGYRILKGPLEHTEPFDPRAILLSLLPLVDRCWKVDADLRDFYANLEEDSLGPVYWPELSRETEEGDVDGDLGRIFPVAFKFLDIRRAHICLIYWASLTILWSAMGYTYKILSGILAATSATHNASSQDDTVLCNFAQLPPLEHRTDVASLARNICQSIEFCLADGHGDMGARSAVFPLKVAIETLNDTPGHERETKWAQAAMMRINEAGVQLIGHIPTPLTKHDFLPG